MTGRVCSFDLGSSLHEEVSMKTLITGLSILLRDNARQREPIDKQAAYWEARGEQEILDEVTLLNRAKQHWLIASVLLWLAISVGICAVIADNLIWTDTFELTFSGLLLVIITWFALMLALWMIASVFDKHAGFERWLEAFRIRAPVSPDADSVQTLTQALEMARRYPEVLRYEHAVVARRRLRHEDIRLMREMGAAIQHREITSKLSSQGATAF